MFYLTEFTEVCSFADDTTFFACDENLNSSIKRLKHDSLLAIEWFENNNMNLNQDKCHLLVSGYKQENDWAQIGDEKIWESNKQKLGMCLYYAKELTKNSQSWRDYQIL